MIFNLCYVIFNTSYRRFLARRCCRFNGAAAGAAGAGREAGGDAGAAGAAAGAAGAGREAGAMLGPLGPLLGPLGPVERLGAMLGPVEVLEPLGALPCRLGRHQYKGKKTH